MALRNLLKNSQHFGMEQGDFAVQGCKFCLHILQGLTTKPPMPHIAVGICVLSVQSSRAAKPGWFLLLRQTKRRMIGEPQIAFEPNDGNLLASLC